MILNPLYHEVCAEHGIDPVPDGSHEPRVPDGIPPELADALTVCAERVTEEFLRPALEAAGVEDPGQYAVEFNTERITKITPDGFVMHDMPVRARRPWVSAEALDVTQSIPTITVESL